MPKIWQRQPDHSVWKIRAKGMIKIPKCVNVFKRLRLHDKAWCVLLEETWKRKTHTDFVKFGPFRMFWAGIYLQLTVFLFQLLVSLQLNDGYLFHVSNPLNIEPTLCHVQFQLLAGRHKLWEPNHPSLPPTGSKQGHTSMQLQTQHPTHGH